MTKRDAVFDSLQWLEENAPHSLVASPPSEYGPRERLERALATISYLAAEAEFERLPSLDKRKHSLSVISNLVSKWNEHEHQMLVRFVNDGGYSVRLAELKRAKKETAHHAEWRMNTVRWIEEHAYTYAGSGFESAPKKLEYALKKSRYFAVGTTADPDEIEKRAKELVDKWTEKDHSDFVAFIKCGGYTARLKMLTESESSLSIEDLDGKEVPERIEVALSGAEGRRGGRKAKQVETDAADTEEIEAAVAYASPVAGSW